MPRTKATESQKAFTDEVRSLEERLFLGQLDPAQPDRMKNTGKYSWLYRPSHHAATGLITKEDVTMLTKPGKRLLSVGAHPAYLEQLLIVLGIPAENIMATDNDPAFRYAEGLMDRALFDCTGIWPDIGMFDLIIFPESLCMAVGGDSKKEEGTADSPFPSDSKEAETLAIVLEQALSKLRPDGEIRANGPMSHPNVVKAASTALTLKGCSHSIDYQRYFLTVRPVE
ncbi:MAG: hypothetical protein KBA40_02705 [Candidatus Peribacteraceae bacterium]|nr:hypothetical protein [Candidatus Peribacteraceae bacterium]MBP9850205.1 hypothetical protein [Candidatus Peribacteraceae bacterium]